MFLGTYETKFTGHGRVILPKKLRQEIERSSRASRTKNGIILSKGFENCIWGFSKEDFEKEAKRQLEVSVTEEQGRNVRRFLFSSSEPVELDFQGRFIIPPTLLDYASVGEIITQRVSRSVAMKSQAIIVIIGAGDHFEIWDKQRWETHIEKIGRQYGRIS